MVQAARKHSTFSPFIACAARVVVSVAVVASLSFAPPALALNAERAYEMVSPVYKGGFGVRTAGEIFAAGEDGESVAYGSSGAFAGAPVGSDIALGYLARRGPTGWSTSPLSIPASLAPTSRETEVSPKLESEVQVADAGASAGAAEQEGDEELLSHSLQLPDTAESWEVLGRPLPSVSGEPTEIGIDAATPDLCHMVLESGLALVPAAEHDGRQLYDFARGCGGGSDSPELVGVDDSDHLIATLCPNHFAVALGDSNVLFDSDDQFAVAANKVNALSADGTQIFFTSCVREVSSSAPEHHQLFVRLAGTRTLEVSKPLSEPGACAEGGSCAAAAERASADFAGASEDGSRVYFIAPLAEGQPPLVPGDGDRSANLYEATIGCSAAKASCSAGEREVTSLTEVSHDGSGGGAGVQGTVAVAPDGSRVYFVATGDLLTAAQQQALEAQGRPRPRAGAENLYVFDASGEGATAFVGDLCSGPASSGAVEDPDCPTDLETGVGELDRKNDTNLWAELPHDAQLAGADGRFLVFSAFAQLAPGDSDRARDVYRYDAQAGQLTRVSLGEGGDDANGNGGAFEALIPVAFRGGTVQEAREMDGRAVSEDGSRVVFVSDAPLSPEASPGVSSIYEWHEQAGGEGRVTFVADGDAVHPNEVIPSVGMSPSGNDIFFVTPQGLLPQDTDGLDDLYDARLGGGFPPPTAPAQPCSGDACQGPLTNPAPLLVPGSVAQAPAESAPAATLARPRPKTEPAKAKPVRCRRRYVRRRGKCVKQAKPRKARGGRRASR